MRITYFHLFYYQKGRNKHVKGRNENNIKALKKR